MSGSCSKSWLYPHMSSVLHTQHFIHLSPFLLIYPIQSNNSVMIISGIFKVINPVYPYANIQHMIPSRTLLLRYFSLSFKCSFGNNSTANHAPSSQHSSAYLSLCNHLTSNHRNCCNCFFIPSFVFSYISTRNIPMSLSYNT